jgi:hypothetical protein
MRGYENIDAISVSSKLVFPQLLEPYRIANMGCSKLKAFERTAKFRTSQSSGEK